MFTRRIICSKNSLIFPILRTLGSKYERTTFVSSYKIIFAKIILDRKDIDLYLQTKKNNLENMKISNSITPMFTSVTIDGIKVDEPKEFDNKLGIISAKISEVVFECNGKIYTNIDSIKKANHGGDISIKNEYRLCECNICEKWFSTCHYTCEDICDICGYSYNIINKENSIEILILNENYRQLILNHIMSGFLQ